MEPHQPGGGDGDEECVVSDRRLMERMQSFASDFSALPEPEPEEEVEAQFGSDRDSDPRFGGDSDEKQKQQLRSDRKR